MPTEDNSELEALFAAARGALRATARQKELERKKTVRRPDAAPSPIETAALYSSPENWRATRFLALIHEETKTLLGNFQELVHVSEPGCRRLVLAEGLVPIAGVEHVSGDWWLSRRHEEIAAPERWHEQRTVILPVMLDALAVQSPLVELIISLAHGNIARACLATETQFAQLGDAGDHLLWLPAGTNVLPSMGLQSKIALKIELDKQKESPV